MQWRSQWTRLGILASAAADARAVATEIAELAGA